LNRPVAALSHTLGELAVRFGCELRGDPSQQICCVAPLDSSKPAAIGFAVGPAWRKDLQATRLAAVIVDQRLAPDSPVATLVHSNPHVTFARVTALLYPAAKLVPGIHPSAVVHPSALVDATAQIDPLAIVAAGAQIGARCLVGSHAYVGEGAVLGEDTRLLVRVTLMRGVTLGKRCLIHPGAVIGSDGFGNAREGERWIKVPQVGAVRIGDDVEIGANTTIDCGAIDDTIIGDGVRLDNLIQVGHNVVIGEHTAIASGGSIAGSARIGKRCMIGGKVGIGQIEICDDVVVLGGGAVTAPLLKPGAYSGVWPVEDARHWRRQVGRVRRLDVLTERVKTLEARNGIKSGQDHDD
jgi:UDP-3-O-[3-hydroxymyristoyl] glucosamine N-acyltransferase